MTVNKNLAGAQISVFRPCRLENERNVGQKI